MRVEHSDEDQLIAALIAGARIHIEAQTQTALISQSWRMVLASGDCRTGTLVHGIAASAFSFAFVIYVWKVVVWDKVLGFGTTTALPDDVG